MFCEAPGHLCTCVRARFQKRRLPLRHSTDGQGNNKNSYSLGPLFFCFGIHFAWRRYLLITCSAQYELFRGVYRSAYMVDVSQNESNKKKTKRHATEKNDAKLYTPGKTRNKCSVQAEKTTTSKHEKIIYAENPREATSWEKKKKKKRIKAAK